MAHIRVRHPSGALRASQSAVLPTGQRFGSALNRNVHFHMLWLDGVYEDTTERPQRKPRLRRARAPTSAQLTHLADTIAHRVCRHLTRKGWLEGEDQSVFLSDSAADDDGMDGLRMSSITYRIASGRDAGRKVVTVQTLLGDAGALEGRVRYPLKTPWRNGTTHMEFEPVDFMGKLAALIPPPRAHLTRFHGIFVPNAKLRAQLTPAHRGKGGEATSDATNPDDRTPDEKRRAMTWAQRLKRVLLRASCPPPFGPAYGCSQSLPAIGSASTWKPASTAAAR